MMRKFSICAAGAVFAAVISFSALAEMPALPPNMGNASQGEVSAALSELGFTNLSNARLNGNVYTADGMYEGRHVKLWVDTEAGRIVDQSTSDLTVVTTQPNMTEADMKAALEDQGYSNVRDMTKSGSIFLATAEKDGETERLRVDSETGIVTNEEDRSASPKAIDDTHPVTGREPLRDR